MLRAAGRLGAAAGGRHCGVRHPPPPLVTSKIDIFRASLDPLDLDELTTAIEDFNTIFIRLPSVRKLNFSTLSVLHTLSRKGPLRLTELTATEQLKQPAITSLVAKLEREGLVSRRPDPRDGRAVLLSLTPEGEEIVRSRHADRLVRLSRLVDRLSDEERSVLAGSARVLARLTEIAAVIGD